MRVGGVAVLVLASVLGVGCGDASPAAPDAGAVPDAGRALDTGGGADGGSGIDAGSGNDAGRMDVVEDAGEPSLDAGGADSGPDAGALSDAGPSVDAGVDAGSADAALPGDGGSDATVPLDGGADASTPGGGGCLSHHDCDSGDFCHRGVCRAGDPPVYHCGKLDCPPGHWCVEADGRRAICAESLDYPCSSACDCGPAHCCIDIDPDPGIETRRCVGDPDDPFSPSAPTPGTDAACDIGVDATYCTDDPACFPARRAWQATAERDSLFTAYDETLEGSTFDCDATFRTCFGSSCDCERGEVCVDTLSLESAPGALCGEGNCVGEALAEAVFAYGPEDLLPCCADARRGESCHLDNWQHVPTPNAAVYSPVVATNLRDCACGDMVCCPGEETTCIDDCRPGRCGDGVCDVPFETGGACTEDCSEACGDAVCEDPEDASTCPSDCPTCGDGLCASPELPGGLAPCEADCASACTGAQLAAWEQFPHREEWPPTFCGDGQCEYTTRMFTCDLWVRDFSTAETWETCPSDCPERFDRRTCGGTGFP